MIRRVNFTGRKRIPRDCVDIEVFDGDPRTFSGAIDLSGKGFPDDAIVVVEATCARSSLVKRFECGAVQRINAPAGQRLDGLTGDHVFFCLKVIDSQQQIGRILGVCENIRPARSGKQTVTGRQGILPVERATLGDELWRLDFKEHNVFLLVNEAVPDLWERVRSDAQFHAVVYPEIVRRVLDRAIGENVDLEDDDDRWPVQWLRFGRELHPSQASPPSSDDNREERDEWIDEVVSAFCHYNDLKSRYLSMRPSESEA